MTNQEIIEDTNEKEQSSSFENIGNEEDIDLTKGFEEDSEDDLEKQKEALKDFCKASNFPDGFDDWPFENRRNWFEEKMKMLKLRIPEELSMSFLGYFRPGDCKRPALEKPEWLDMEKFRRGQKFALDHYFGTSFAIMLGSIVIYSFDDEMKPMIITRKSSTPYTSFRRFLKTASIFRDWYESDPWTKGTKAHETLQNVRKQHQKVRDIFERKDNDEIDNLTKISNPWCPMRNVLMDDFQASIPNNHIMSRPYEVMRQSPWRPKGLNQASMSATQFAMMGFFLLYPKYFGTYATDQELDDFCHLWRVLGYMLGIEDEYNFANGSVDDIRKRGNILMESWIKPNFRTVSNEWEHMSRCLVEGVTYYFPGITYETVILYLGNMMDLPMPRFRSAVSFFDRFTEKLIRFAVCHITRIPGVVPLLNKYYYFLLRRAEKYSPEKHAQLQKRSNKTLFTTVSAS